MTFSLPGILKRKGRRKSEIVSLFLDAGDRDDALWQARHGVIEANVSESFPGASIKYDIRRLRRYIGRQ